MSQVQEPPSFKPSKDINEINKRLMDLRNRGAHLIGPGVQSLVKVETIPVGYEMNWHCFMFDPNFENGPDFYRDKRWPAGEVAFKREALLKMWMAAGSRELDTRREDDGSDPYLVRWRFCGAVQDFSGNWVPAQATKELDLRQNSAGADAMKAGQLSQQRQDIVQLAESKAQNRVIRKLLGIRQKYTAEEIAKPFVLMRLVFVPNMNDPATKLFVLANSYGATAALFGNPDFTRMILSSGTETPETENGNRQLPPAAPQAALTAAQASPAAKATGLSPKEERVLDFRAADVDQQIRILETMMSKKGFGADKLNKPIQQFTEANRAELFSHLLELADAPEPAFKL